MKDYLTEVLRSKIKLLTLQIIIFYQLIQNKPLMYNILSIDTLFPNEVAKTIAENVKKRRLDNNLTQEGLSLRAGVKLPTYRRFERTGEISLRGLLQIANALNLLEEFTQLFTKKQYQSLEEVLNKNTRQRKRGKKNE